MPKPSRDNVAALMQLPLICPKTRARLLRDGDWLVSIDPENRLRYPIRNDIPVLLVEEATFLSVAEWTQILDSHREEADRLQKETEKLLAEIAARDKDKKKPTETPLKS